MRARRLSWLRGTGCAGLALVVRIASVAAAAESGACVVHDTSPVNAGYGYGPGGPGGGGGGVYATAGVAVGEPSSATVSSLPPEPLYEQMTVSPGFGYVWIDGSWHWNNFEWIWVSGRWVREQGATYVYVQPSYDYASGAYVYRPGYWASRDRVPSGWSVRDHRDGRPAVVAPPPGVLRPPPVGGPPPVPPAAARVRDHRAPRAPAGDVYAPPAARVRDHRDRR